MVDSLAIGSGGLRCVGRLTVFPGLIFLCSCSLLFGSGEQAAVDGGGSGDAAANDGAVDAALGVPCNLDAPFAGINGELLCNGTLTISGNVTLDSASGGLSEDGVVIGVLPRQDRVDYDMYAFENIEFTVGSILTLEGSLPVVFVAKGNAIIDGEVIARPSDGDFVEGECSGSDGVPGDRLNRKFPRGGSGAGFASIGGAALSEDGGDADSQEVLPDRVQNGCWGGRGIDAEAQKSIGGRPGRGLAFVSGSELRLNSTADFTLNGGGGLAGQQRGSADETSAGSSGSGGGSGGLLYLHSPVVVLAGNVYAHGGGGGAGSFNDGREGSNGGTGGTSLAGLGGQPPGDPGGRRMEGGMGFSLTTVLKGKNVLDFTRGQPGFRSCPDGSAPECDLGGGGGGGGGLGYLIINTADLTEDNPTISAEQVSQQ